MPSTIIIHTYMEFLCNKEYNDTMQQKERLTYLVNYLLDENKMLGGMTIPEDEKMQKELLKTLIALREPSGVPLDFSLIQSEFLKEEINAIGIEKPETKGLFTLTEKPLYALDVDAIVNFADNSLMGSFMPESQSLDDDIHFYAGTELRLAAADITQRERGLLKCGDIRITGGFAIPAKSIIHAIGPDIRREATDEDKKKLESLVYGIIESAEELEAKTIAIAPYTRRYRKFPISDAIRIMVDAIKSYPLGSDVRIIISLAGPGEIEIAKSIIEA